VVVDLVCNARIDVAERIVRKCGQVNDGFETGQVGGRDISHILADTGYVRQPATGKIAAAVIELTVIAMNIMAS
jgi:hypothetical protein